MHRYPLIAAAIARPTPVLPEVGSTIVPPGSSFPSRSAASIIERPIRSFTDPPGFRNSSFARIVPGTSREIRSSRTMGVLPTRSRTLGSSRDIPLSLYLRLGRYRLPCGGELVPLDQGHGGQNADERDPEHDPERPLGAARKGLPEGDSLPGQVVEVADRDR